MVKAGINRGIRGGSDRLEETWIVFGTDLTATEVLDEAETTTSLALDGLPRSSHRLQELTRNHFIVTAEYSNDQPKAQREQSGEITFAFEDGTEEQNIPYAIKTEKDFAIPGVANKPKLGDMIRPNDSGKMIVPEGTGVHEPVSGFSYTLTDDEVFFDDAKRREIGTLRAHVNHATWKSYPRGEVLFLGCTGSVASSGKSSIQFRFAVRNNVVVAADGSYTTGGVSVPGPYTLAGVDLTSEAPFTREGWWFPDIYSRKSFDNAGNQIAASVRSIRFLRLYEYGDFTLLGLGS